MNFYRFIHIQLCDPSSYPTARIYIYTSNREQEIWNFIGDLESERFCYDFIKERIKRKNSWKRANQIFKKKKSLKGIESFKLI